MNYRPTFSDGAVLGLLFAFAFDATVEHGFPTAQAGLVALYGAYLFWRITR